MSIRILHVHVHVHVQSTRIKRDSRKSRRVQIMTTATTAIAGSRQQAAGRASRGQAACRQRAGSKQAGRLATRDETLTPTPTPTLTTTILVGVEFDFDFTWVAAVLPACCPPACCLRSASPSSSAFCQFSPALTRLSYCLLPVLLLLLSTNAQSKTQRPTVSPLLLLLLVVVPLLLLFSFVVVVVVAVRGLCNWWCLCLGDPLGFFIRSWFKDYAPFVRLCVCVCVWVSPRSRDRHINSEVLIYFLIGLLNGLKAFNA